EIMADADGFPRTERQLVLLDCRLEPGTIQQDYPALWTYLESGKRGSQPVAGRYLCRTRKPWYSQEQRPPAPLLCTYMGRRGKSGQSPFRFFLNHSAATAGNVFLLLYPKPRLTAEL